MNQKRVLIIDADVDLADNMAQRLDTLVFSVEVVSTGQDGLAAVLSEPFDIILLDLQISDMDALGVLDRLKDHAPQMEIICLIGHDARATGIEAIERGAFDFLYKPLDLALLLDKIAIAAG